MSLVFLLPLEFSSIHCMMSNLFLLRKRDLVSVFSNATTGTVTKPGLQFFERNFHHNVNVHRSARRPVVAGTLATVNILILLGGIVTINNPPD